MRPRSHWRIAAAMLVALAWNADSAGAQRRTQVKLTSPLGRSGVAGTVRVVAQVVTSAPGGMVPVRFFVDDRLLGEDLDGPPYVTEWVDENPYEPREIRVEVTDGPDDVVRDLVRLEPLAVVEEAHVASVLVETAVSDERGKPIATLVADDFTLFENDAKQTLDLVQLQRMPTQFTLLVDSSQSMGRRIDLVRATARRLVSRLREGDTVVVAPFRNGVEAVTGPTNDAATIAEAIAGIRATGGTAILDSLGKLPDLFARTDARHVVILVSDGYDEHSRTELAAAVTAVQRLHATVYVVGIGGVAGISLKGEQLLRTIAGQTGGRCFFPSREEQLPDVHELIAADVYSRYLLTYTPVNQEPDGTYRAIRVVTSEASHRVTARAGYFAPKPPPVKPTIEFSVSGAGEDALGIDDLTIVEDGVEQRIETFEEATAPMSLVLALDASGSMKPVLNELRAAASSFVSALRPADPLSLLQFADRVTIAHEFSGHRPLSTEAIATHPASGGTALFDALHSAMGLLNRQQTRRAVVVVTDGRDENNAGTAAGSEHSLSDVLQELKKTDTTVYAIGLGPNVDRAALQQLADASGGAAFFPAEVTSLPEEYRRVLEDLRRRYVISYVSTNPARDGAWRTVAITTDRPGLTIRSRGGFEAPRSGTASAPEHR